MKHFSNINLNLNELQYAVIQNLNTVPITASIGQIYYDTTISKLKLYTAAGWVILTTSGPSSIPTLQQVTIAGNVTTLDIYANSFYTNTGYALMDDGTAIVDNVQFGSTLSYLDYNGVGVNIWQLPNQSGTIALTSNIPTITPSALTKTNDTNVTLTLGGTPNTALLQGVSITVGWTGTLADTRITSATNWNTAYTNRITSLTTTGSGAATLVANVLNIPTPNLTGFVPYTGATTTVNLGSQSLIAGGISVGTITPNAKVYIVGSSGYGGLGFATNTLNHGMAFISTVAMDTAIAPYEGDLVFSAPYWDGVIYTFPERFRIAGHTGNIGIDVTVPTQKLHVNGNARITGAIYDSVNSPGTSGQVLSSTATGTSWINSVPGGIASINALTSASQVITTGTAGTNFFVNSSGSVHTLNLPTASAINRGALSSTDWITFNSKQDAITLTTTGTGAATFVSNVLNIPTPSLTGYVPYTGATGNINIGANDIFTAGGARLADDGTVIAMSISFTPSTSSLQDTSTVQNVWQLPDQSGVIALTSDITAATNLNAVLTNGNTSILNAKVGGIYLYNPNVPSGLGYVYITGDKNRFNFYNNANVKYGHITQDSLVLIDSVTPARQFEIRKPATIGATRVATFQDADGTVAYLSDIPSLTGFVPYTGANQAVNLGTNNLTANSFIKSGGTSTQFLMADGSVTTSGPLFKATSSTTATGVVSVISNAILGSLFTNGSILKIQTMVTFGPSQTLNITPLTYYINTSPSLVGATQIATYDISAGQRYAWMDRSFWSIGVTFNARNFLNSSQTSVSNSGSTLGSTSIPATFYIIASMNVGVGDLGTIASILVEKI